MIGSKLYLKITTVLTLMPLILLEGDSFSYTWADQSEVVSYTLDFDASNADCTFSTTDNPALVKITGNYDQGNYIPTFEQKIDNAQFVFLRRGGKINADGSIDFNFNPFKSEPTKSKEQKNDIQVYLSKRKTANLDLDFRSGFGKLNLSGLPLKTLNLRAGSADVDLVYQLNQPNAAKMDTLMLQADAGTISSSYLDYFNSTNVSVEVKYGKVKLGFSPSAKMPIKLNAQVTAGRLEINLPENESPVLLRLKRSRMAGAIISPSLKSNNSGYYTNEHYYVNAPGVIFLDIALNGGSLEISD